MSQQITQYNKQYNFSDVSRQYYAINERTIDMPPSIMNKTGSIRDNNGIMELCDKLLSVLYNYLVQYEFYMYLGGSEYNDEIETIEKHLLYYYAVARESKVANHKLHNKIQELIQDVFMSVNEYRLLRKERFNSGILK